LFHLIKNFSGLIIDWYEKNKRDLPWRKTNDPYLIWLSEIILQQTRVEQGLPYYLKFVSRFPTISDLANAPIDEVLKLWQGLGYYSRARNMHETAIFIVQNFNGVFPDKYADIKALKGIGEYTASAIVSFAYNAAYPVVDGNVFRVISRLFGINTPIDSNEGKKEILEIANKLICKKNPGVYNQAIMEFGALQCKPQKPDCPNCIFKSNCYAFNNECIDDLPVKSIKLKPNKRYFYYFVINYHSKRTNFCYIKKRKEKDIWQGLYDFPAIEKKDFCEIPDLVKSREWKKIFGDTDTILKDISKVYTHPLTHQLIFARFISLNIKGELKTSEAETYILVNVKDLNKYALPRLIDIYINEKKTAGS
jgi:A/G-specific adenine glycosylase